MRTKSSISRINVEILTNLSCPRRCPGCDRMCNVFPERKEEMTLDQIEKFIQQMRNARGKIRVKKCKLAGGESTYHPKFKEIYWLLFNAMVNEDLFDMLKINMSDHPDAPRPADIPDHPRVRWLHSPLKKKAHLPYGYAPVDLGQKGTPCRIPWTCGIALSPRGYSPCSASEMVIRAFDLEHLYKQELPDAPWGLHRVDGKPSPCEYCTHGCDQSWKEQWFKDHKPLTKTTPTASWLKALAHYEEKEGIQNKLFSDPGRTPLPLV